MNEKSKKARSNGAGAPQADTSGEEILALLTARAGELTNLRTAAVKYPMLRKVLARAVGELPPDTRLPGIRNLAQALGVSLVTAQRVVRELSTQGVLYSKPRAGVFVAEQVMEGAERPFANGRNPAVRHPFRATFQFGTDSAAPYQRKFWEEIAELFCKQHPNTAPSLVFGSEIPHTGQPLDVYERYDWTRTRFDEASEVLNIADFAGALAPPSATSEGLLPLYHRTYFLFFNRSLLERHGLPLPDYRTFEGQTEYLRQLKPDLVRLGIDPQPYSIQEPVTLFGGWIKQFISLFDDEAPDEEGRQKFIITTEKLLSFCRLCRYSMEDRNDWVQGHDAFLRGETPFFMGYSVDYWEFSRKNLPFALGAYPVLCCDDALFLWTRVGAISRYSEHPVECINFLDFLLRPEIQKRIAATGNFGASPATRFMPEFTADEEWLRDVLRVSPPFHLNSKEHYYIAINVLGGEIWRSLLGNTTAKEVLQRATQLGHSYLQHSSRKR